MALFHLLTDFTTKVPDVYLVEYFPLEFGDFDVRWNGLHQYQRRRLHCSFTTQSSLNRHVTSPLHRIQHSHAASPLRISVLIFVKVAPVVNCLALRVVGCLLNGGGNIAQVTTECPIYLTMGRPFPPQNCPFPWGIWTPNYYAVPLAHPSPNPNGISIALAVFAGLTSVTDRQTTLLGR